MKFGKHFKKSIKNGFEQHYIDYKKLKQYIKKVKKNGYSIDNNNCQQFKDIIMEEMFKVNSFFNMKSGLFSISDEIIEYSIINYRAFYKILKKWDKNFYCKPILEEMFTIIDNMDFSIAVKSIKNTKYKLE